MLGFVRGFLGTERLHLIHHKDVFDFGGDGHERILTFAARGIQFILRQIFDRASGRKNESRRLLGSAWPVVARQQIFDSFRDEFEAVTQRRRFGRF